MDHTAILAAAELLPRDHALGVRRQTEALDALAARLAATEPGAPGADEALREAHRLAQALYHEASTHPNRGRPDSWYLSVIGVLNGQAKRLGLEMAPAPFTLDR